MTTTVARDAYTHSAEQANKLGPTQKKHALRGGRRGGMAVLQTAPLKASGVPLLLNQTWREDHEESTRSTPNPKGRSVLEGERLARTSAPSTRQRRAEKAWRRASPPPNHHTLLVRER